MASGWESEGQEFEHCLPCSGNLQPLVAKNQQRISSPIVCEFHKKICEAYLKRFKTFVIFASKLENDYGKSWRLGNASRNETNEILTVYLQNLWGFIPRRRIRLIRHLDQHYLAVGSGQGSRLG